MYGPRSVPFCGPRSVPVCGPGRLYCLGGNPETREYKAHYDLGESKREYKAH